MEIPRRGCRKEKSPIRGRAWSVSRRSTTEEMLFFGRHSNASIGVCPMQDHSGGCSAKVTRLPSPSNTSTILTKRFLVTWGRFSPLSKIAPDKVKLSVNSSGPGTESTKVSLSASTTRANGKSTRSASGDTRNTCNMEPSIPGKYEERPATRSCSVSCSIVSGQRRQSGWRPNFTGSASGHCGSCAH